MLRKPNFRPFLLAFLLACAAPRSAEACSCVSQDGPLLDSVVHADAVFVGVATSRERISQEKIVFTFRTERVWKGPTGGTLEIVTRAGSGACGIDFVLEERYLVFAHAPPRGGEFDEGGGRLGTSICTPTRDLVYNLFPEDELPPAIEPFDLGLGRAVPLADVTQEVLSERLTSFDSVLRVQALAALPSHPDAMNEAMPHLLALLEEGGDDATRAQLMHTLRELGPRSAPALEALSSRLVDASASRSVLPNLRALGAAAAPAVPALIRLLDVSTEIAALQDEAERTPSAQENFRLDLEIRNLRSLPGEVALVLAEIGPEAAPAVPALWDALHAGRVPASAAPSLIALGVDPSEVALFLSSELRHQDPERRAAAARGFAELDAETAVPELLAMLEDSSGEVLRQSVQALARFGPDAAPAVPRLLEIRDRILDEVSVRALVAICGENPELIELVADHLLRHGKDSEGLAMQLRWLPFADALLPFFQPPLFDPASADEAYVATASDLRQILDRVALTESEAREAEARREELSQEPRPSNEELKALAIKYEAEHARYLAEEEAAREASRKALEGPLEDVLPRRAPRSGKPWPETLRLAIGNPLDPITGRESYKGGISSLNSLAVSDETIVVGSFGSNVFLFDAQTGKLRRRLSDPANLSDDFNESHFGARVGVLGDKILVSADQDGVLPYRAGLIYIYNLDGTMHGRLTSPDPKSEESFGEEFLARGRRVLVTAPGDRSRPDRIGKLYLFNQDGELLLTRPYDPPPESCVWFSQPSLALFGEETFAVARKCSDHGRGALFHQADGRRLADLRPPTADPDFGCALEVAGGHLVAATCSAEIRFDLFDPSGGTHRRRITLHGYLSQGSSVSLAAWGEHRLLFAVSGAGVVRSLDLRTGQVVGGFTAPNPVVEAAVTWDPSQFGDAIFARGEEVFVLAPSDALSPSSLPHLSGGGAVYVFVDSSRFQDDQP